MLLRQLLLVRSSQPENVYGPFVAEILKTEGLSGFETVDLDTSPMPDLQPDDLVILTRCLLSKEEADHLTRAVQDGTRIVCLQPPWPLVQRFGWASTRRVAHPGWIKIRDGYPGSGTPIQTHVPLTTYRPTEPVGEWQIIADAVDANWNDSGFPAVLRQKAGAGEVAFFFYDLPKAIARIRFGNPELASFLNSGEWGWIHTLDLFEGHVDERVLHLPQADFHAQLLARVLTDISPYPLARLWYYEEAGQRAAAMFSSDDDWSTPEQFEDLSSSLAKRGGKATFYLVQDTYISEEAVQAYRAQGHSFGPHVNAFIGSQLLVKDDEKWNFIFPQRLEEETRMFKERFGEVSKSLQCHAAPWLGYMTWLPEFVRHSYRLLFAYLSAPRWLNQYMCGSGRPCKFVDEDGTLYDCWQQPLPTYDDLTLEKRIKENLDEVVKGFEDLLHPILDRFHTGICMASHPISFPTYSKPFLEACWDQLQRENVPIYSGDEWCDFQDRRHAVQVRQHRTADNGLRLVVSGLSGRLPLMLPIHGSSNGAPEVTVNGTRTAGVMHHRLEQDYLYIQLEGREEGEIEIEVAT